MKKKKWKINFKASNKKHIHLVCWIITEIMQPTAFVWMDSFFFLLADLCTLSLCTVFRKSTIFEVLNWCGHLFIFIVFFASLYCFWHHHHHHHLDCWLYNEQNVCIKLVFDVHSLFLKFFSPFFWLKAKTVIV